MSEDWELSHEGSGKTVVRLETESAEEITAAKKALPGTDAERVIDLT